MGFCLIAPAVMHMPLLEFITVTAFALIMLLTKCSACCSLEFGTYIFFAFWVFVMTMYVIFFLPETKGVPIEEMGILWRRHWFWSKVIMTPEERAAFQKGDMYGAGVTTGDIVPGNAAQLGKGEMSVADQQTASVGGNQANRYA